jgi:hypothetical protein
MTCEAIRRKGTRTREKLQKMAIFFSKANRGIGTETENIESEHDHSLNA